MAQVNTGCGDVKCPVHGELKARGRTITGTVVSAKAQKSAVVAWEYTELVPKYGRYLKKRSRVSVHSPDCIDVQEGDQVKIRECRPISKTKRFVIIEKLGTKRTYELEKELSESAKVKKEKKAPGAEKDNESE